MSQRVAGCGGCVRGACSTIRIRQRSGDAGTHTTDEQSANDDCASDSPLEFTRPGPVTPPESRFLLRRWWRRDWREGSKCWIIGKIRRGIADLRLSGLIHLDCLLQFGDVPRCNPFNSSILLRGMKNARDHHFARYFFDIDDRLGGYLPEQFSTHSMYRKESVLNAKAAAFTRDVQTLRCGKWL